MKRENQTNARRRLPGIMDLNTIYNEDCLEGMSKLPANSIDAVVTDPPYGLKFMGRKWDYNVPSVEIWTEVLRVLKPGGHVLSFGGTRTYHRMVVNLEDAGLEPRDTVSWIFGSGLPKSLSVSKAIDKAAGAKRKTLALKTRPDGSQRPNAGAWDYSGKHEGFQRPWMNDAAAHLANNTVTAPATKDAKQCDGWGTALKPAVEMVCLARKPLSEKTVAANVLRWGTGALNVDACRIGTDQIKTTKTAMLSHNGENHRPWHDTHKNSTSLHTGRWPANVILDEEAGAMLDQQSGISSERARVINRNGLRQAEGYGLASRSRGMTHADSGGASRFFYCAKASRKERGEGNNHPTVKPISLISYLIRLITPPNGIVLDPFAGSGTTALACMNEHVNYVGFEREKQYWLISQARIKNHKPLLAAA